MNIPGLGVDSATAIKPTSSPNPIEYEFDADVLADVAVEQRMEMLELELRLIQDAINIDSADNQLLPLLDLNASYQINGLGDSLGDAFGQLRDNRFEDWSVGVTAQVPLGNKAAKSRYRRAVLSRMQRLSTRQARELAIRREVYDAVDTIEQSWRRILAARQSVILNTRTLEAEQRQFDVGVRTSTDVLDAAAALASAQSAEARALTDYQIAQVDLAAATGTLLGADRIRWEPVRYDEVDVRGVIEAPPHEGD
jgi:outer membrane protein TolC